MKGWPCCYTNPSPLGRGCSGWLSQHGITAGEVEAGELRFPAAFRRGTAEIAARANGLEALLSVEYVTAAALIDHDVTLQSFTDPMVARPEVQALMRRVSPGYENSLGGGVHSWRDGQVEVGPYRTPRGRFAT